MSSPSPQSSVSSGSSSTLRGPGLELEVLSGLDAPHSAAGERLLLASVLADDKPASWALACNLGVRAEAFYLPLHRAVWQAIDTLHRAGTRLVDLAVVAEHLATAGTLEAHGGFAAIAAIAEGAPTPLHTRFAGESIVLLWHRRYALYYASLLRNAALESGTREAFVKTAGGLGQRLIRLGRRERAQTLADIYAEVKSDAEARIAGTVDKSRWISSGLERFDRICRPFGSAREDHYVIFAGGSGHGKSVALRNIAAATLRAGKRVLSYSRETSTAGFIEMLVAAELGIDLNTLEHLPKDRAAAFTAEFDRQMRDYADRLLFCVEHTAATPLFSVDDICDHARAFVHLHGPPDLVLVDYLQLFDAGKSGGKLGGSREAAVAHVSHRLQALQRELGCVMLTAAQLNESGLNEMRQIKRDEDGRVIHRMPKPGDLRESQAAYHDADRVIFLYKPPVDCRGTEQVAAGTSEPEVWWYQEKRRRGCAGSFVRCWFQKRYTRFVACGEEEIAAADREAAAPAVVPPGQRLSKSQWKTPRP